MVTININTVVKVILVEIVGSIEFFFSLKKCSNNTCNTGLLKQCDYFYLL